MSGPRATDGTFPFTHHRHMGKVIADEAITRRRRAKTLAYYRDKGRAHRVRKAREAQRVHA